MDGRMDGMRWMGYEKEHQGLVYIAMVVEPSLPLCET